MASEAVIVDLGTRGGNPIQFTVAEDAGILKGTICKLTSPRTAAACTADSDIFAGIAAADKVADDGSTTLALYQEGIFDIVCEGPAIAAGKMVTISGANNTCEIYTAGDNELGGMVGRILETGPGVNLVAIKGPFNG